mmetsp:Transcript_39732/g.55330  ORF Transcript_39732/g.55330 Transcript_39732/m.55330 type:complete len:730 (+) Transcript_39732:130-2319(+)|eukprot:CAMPEP_0201488950 /NCGR_PEP_ID=MMETSP0151_2-20130828/20643_1 /ASSEMBLY_ACC=CAM_ASM_000257 /TAXON_ID=200890 /ORGANISM="Paramoeba atlantica, Strain 621/1 / CCAP 1560/9" /LENGTH=729 /DNA_ID=CAMNT_0047874393 /DNA_START=71 /DNA_END=2260 /DNA_ORIENTATION=+
MKWPTKSSKVEVEKEKEREKEEEVDEEDSEMSEKEESHEKKEAPVGKKFCQFCRQEIPIKAIRCYHCHADQVLKVKKNDVVDELRIQRFPGFKLLLRDIIDENDLEAGPVFTDTEFKIKEKSLKNSLSRQGIQLVHRGLTEEEQKAGYIKGEKLVLLLPKLKAYWATEKSSIIRTFLGEITKLQETMIKQIKALLEKKKTVFPALWFIFEQGCQIYSWKSGSRVGASIVKSEYHYHFNLIGEMVKTDGEQFFYIEENFQINNFPDVKKLEDLEVQMMTDEVMDELIERGQLFNNLGLGHHFRQYSGYMMRSFSKFFTHKIPADGRVMVDAATFNRRHPSDESFRYSGATSTRSQQRQTSQYQYDHWGGSAPVSAVADPNKFRAVADEDLFMCWPTLPAFSFKKKQWGEILVSLCQEIVFDDKAFDQLVLEKDKKSLIKSLVECNEQKEISERGFSDIISGKGGGCIFLLHGPPGTGKTLTAEAVSEHLHTPLYSVSVGELGTTPESLESNLQAILEVAGIWKASILMDEADIFLERRTKSNIMRNAMVGIFLRLLEYHNGVLFLTTNRIKSIDEAFSSRISIALHYEDLDHVARGAVWHNFMKHLQDSEGEDAVSDDLDYDELVSYNLNGRQIRSTIKLSRSLSLFEKKPLSMEHLRSTISVALSFEEKFEEQVLKKRREKHIYKNRLDKKKGKEEVEGEKTEKRKKKEKKRTTRLTLSIKGSDSESDY